MENYSKGQMLVIGILMALLPTAAVTVRLWAKSLSQKGVKMDDYLIVGALVRIPWALFGFLR